MADIDYEIYKYINELADQYIELDDLLEQNGVSYSEALEQAAQFRKQFCACWKSMLSAIRIWLSFAGT